MLSGMVHAVYVVVFQQRAPEELVVEDVLVVGGADPVHLGEDVVVGEAQIQRNRHRQQREHEEDDHRRRDKQVAREGLPPREVVPSRPPRGRRHARCAPRGSQTPVRHRHGARLRGGDVAAGESPERSPATASTRTSAPHGALDIPGGVVERLLGALLLIHRVVDRVLHDRLIHLERGRIGVDATARTSP